MSEMTAPRFFLKIDGIKGDARPKNHDGEIEIVSWSFGETQTGAVLDARKPVSCVAMRDFVFKASTGASSSQLLLLCAAGKRLKSAVLTCEKDFGKTRQIYLTITLTDVMLATYEIWGIPEELIPVDSFSMKFVKIDFKYVALSAEGSPGGNFSASWDLSSNA